MSIDVFQAILIGVVYYLGFNGTPWLTNLGATIANRPLIAGTLVGYILGDPVTGCVIGAAINLPFLATISAGGTVPMDPGLAGTIGTALALAAGATPQVAVVLAVIVGFFGSKLFALRMTVDIKFLHMADKAAAEGDYRKLVFLNIVPPQLFLAFITVIPVALVVYFGADIMTMAVKSLSATPLHVLTVIGGILPAFGIAMNLRAIVSKNIILFFLIGFILQMYFHVPIIVISIIGFIIAVFYIEHSMKNEGAR
ncbi:PTS mannose/fructose/sorbose/N-acetylgalactosamine transporter subunit IIC [Propionispora hippei]|uniref:PTS system, mannose-specific IIC component n=1 Tax=Propionispora hippei DSM 15287 TaxID=1123003 RepID=A0A1M6I1C1_9FIRM|nr:PTS sugar transporter subunit IIC [Propionispora hippei]SHJ28227.1 PTS system, mannose-specific IIC component [Propionispora hippei DSM 15287]